MKRLYLFSILLLLAIAVVPARASHEAPVGDYLLFMGSGCPHCANVEEYLETVELPNEVNLVWYDIYLNRADAALFNEQADRLGIPLQSRGIPFLIAPDGTSRFGDAPIINYFKSAIKHEDVPAEDEGAPTTCGPDIPGCSEPESKRTLPVLVSAALADSINPCAFAVLILLMTSMLATGDRRRALLAAAAFIATIFVSYFAMGAGLWRAFASVSSVFWVYAVVGALAVFIGLLNIKDALWYGKVFLMEVPLSWRPKMKSLIRSITSPGGAILIALAVSLFLLPCTSGPYIVVLGLLSKQAFNQEGLSLLALYNFIFVLPMVVLAAITYAGVSVKRAEAWRQDHVRLLHAVAGIVMLGIGVWVLLGL
ncbi:MAG: hypothetical protein HY462_00305 [Parcubacteria group bacterium]|nr:hypothetical protein [Parcubacteria group bacterium]